MTPTPAIIDVTTVGPTSSTIFSLRPSSDGMSTKTPPQKTVLRRSRRDCAILPVTAIVSAWNETVATESKAKEPAAPTRNASAVGKAAKPSESARSPCGTPFSTTATAASRSVIYASIKNFLLQEKIKTTKRSYSTRAVLSIMRRSKKEAFCYL